MSQMVCFSSFVVRKISIFVFFRESMVNTSIIVSIACILWQRCNEEFSTVSIRVPFYLTDFPRIIPRDVDPEAITPPSCNYALSTISGTIVASPQSCPRGAAWVIRVANNKRIRLEFLTFNLYLPQEYVRIRDGVNARAKILAFNTGQLIPSTVTSTGNQIYVEYEVFAKGKPPERGFSATYTSLG